MKKKNDSYLKLARYIIDGRMKEKKRVDTVFGSVAMLNTKWVVCSGSLIKGTYKEHSPQFDTKEQAEEYLSNDESKTS